MRLRRLRILNFRCCKDLEIEVGTMHALVGANNAGKSTILRALDFLFNPSTSKINEECFWSKDTSLEIRVEALFVDLLPRELEALAGYTRPDTSFQLARTAKFGMGGEGDAENEADARVKIGQEYNRPQPKYDWLVDGNITGKRIAEWKKKPDDLNVRGQAFLPLLSGKETVGNWQDKAKEFATAYLTQEDYVDTWMPNPQGFPNVLKANLPHFELIPAVREASDESKVLKTNPFGRLIQEILRTLQADLKADITQKLKDTTRRLNRESGDHRLPEVAEVENSMKAYLSEVMPADLEIEFQAPTVETILSTPKIYVDDGFKGAIDGKGHGLQRAVIFSILRSYAKLVTSKHHAGKRTLILGVEEPELYMHPTAQRTIRAVLRTIADGGDQVLFSTHSPLLVDVAYFDEIVRVEMPDREPGKTVANGARVFQLPMAAMIEDLVVRHPKLQGKVTDVSMRERYGHAYTPSRNEGFFAKKVILVEGPTESYSLPIFAKAAGRDFDTAGVAVIECGGKDQIDRLCRIFNELGVPCYVLFDYDLGNAAAAKASKDMLKFLKGADSDPTGNVVTSTHAYFAATWETYLTSGIPGYDELIAEARTVLGECGKPLLGRYVATKATRRMPPCVPQFLKDVIENAVVASWSQSCLAKN